MSDSNPKPFARRRATPADAETLIGLFNRAFNKQKDARTATWKYFRNPHGMSYTLLAMEPDDASAIGGGYSYVYRKATFRGEPFLATQASDAMVDVPFRKRGIFTSFDDDAARHCGGEGAPVCMAVAGRQSMHGFLKNGWKAIGTYQQYIAVIDAKRVLENRLGPLALPASLVLRAVLSILGRGARTASVQGIETRPVDRFDSRVDALFAKVAPALPIAFVRDANYLNWRYVDTPTQKHRILAAERGEDLVGYAVIEIAHGRGYLVDVLGLDEAVEDALLRAAFGEFRREGCGLALLSTLPCARVAAMLNRNGFFPHPKTTPFRTATPFIVRVLREDANPKSTTLLDPTQWYVFDGDRDVEHVSPV